MSRLLFKFYDFLSFNGFPQIKRNPHSNTHLASCVVSPGYRNGGRIRKNINIPTVLTNIWNPLRKNTHKFDCPLGIDTHSGGIYAQRRNNDEHR